MIYNKRPYRARIEHYRAKAKVTATLGINQRSPKPLDIALWLEGSWEHEEFMEHVLAEERQKRRVIKMFRKAQKPGRNDRCPCGSGKKFKQCCIGQIDFERADSAVS